MNQFKSMLLLCLVASFALPSAAAPSMMGLEGLLVKEVVKKVQKMQSTKTTLVSSQLATSSVDGVLYKDFGHKTEVDVKHVVSTTLFDTIDYSTVELAEPDHISTVLYAGHPMVETHVVKTTPIATSRATVVYEDFEWPVETQTFTVGHNDSMTRVVENELPLF